MHVFRYWESVGRELRCFLSSPGFPSCLNPSAMGQFAQRSVPLRQSQGGNQTPSPMVLASEIHGSHPVLPKQPDPHGALGVMNPPASVLLGSPVLEATLAAWAAIPGLILPLGTCAWLRL